MYVCYEMDMPSSSLSGRKKVGTGAKMPGVKRRGVELVPLLEVMVRGKGEAQCIYQRRRSRDIQKAPQPPRTAGANNRGPRLPSARWVTYMDAAFNRDIQQVFGEMQRHF
jgi:hypothetical protein